MLCQLTIKNYALIEQLDIEFGAGFSVITGETGAGKSIILGAIGLLLGQRADSKSIKQGATKCVVEATFDIAAYDLESLFDANDIDYAPICIIRREVNINGKSRAFINDCPTTLPIMKEVGERLIDIHSQHQNLLVGQADFQLSVVSLLAHDGSLLQQHYTPLYKSYCQTCVELKRAVKEAQRNSDEEELLRYQLSQLEDAKLQEGEVEALEEELQLLEHTEEISAALHKVCQLLCADEQGILAPLKEGYQTLGKITPHFAAAASLTERLQSGYIEIKDIAQELEREASRVVFDPQRLEWVNARLQHIYQLQQKHKCQTVTELMAYAETVRQKLLHIDTADDRIAQLEQQRVALYSQLTDLCAELTSLRRAAATAIAQQMQQSLVGLGMPHAQFVVTLTSLPEPQAMGCDKVEFLFSANKNAPQQPIAQIASGGEIARVMLSLKAMIAQATHLPTILFDEIDTGVSGEIARAMAQMMRQMGDNNHQVISITHLPQIASMGSAHYYVYKKDNEESTATYLRRLSSDERIQEIAHMLSGATLTEAAISNAKALLNEV